MTDIHLPQNIDLQHTRALVFLANQVVLITANKRDDWTYETVLDDAAALIENQSHLIEG